MSEPIECSDCGCRHMLNVQATETDKVRIVRGQCRNCGRMVKRRDAITPIQAVPDLELQT